MFQKYPGIFLKELFRIEKFSVAWVSMQPGTTYPLHMHKVSAERYILLAGKVQLTLGERQLSLSGGSHVRIPPQTPHSVKNTGNRKLIFLTTSAPAFQDADTVSLH